MQMKKIEPEPTVTGVLEPLPEAIGLAVAVLRDARTSVWSEPPFELLPLAPNSLNGGRGEVRLTGPGTDALR